MILRYHKSKDPSKLGGLTVLREDGTSEYQALTMAPGFIAHEFAHYAAETELGLRDSFLGLLSRGRHLGQLAQTAENWTDLPVEAMQTEFLAGQFQSEFMGEFTPLEERAFNKQLETSCRRAGLPPPRVLRSDELARVRAALHSLLTRWRELTPGKTMELRFPHESPASA